jgi:hypothetical protein
MKAFIAAVLAVIGIGFGASIILERFQHSSETAYTSPTGVRLDSEPSHTGAPKS